MRKPFEWVVAMRFLREGKTQTLLILAGIGVGVGVIIFISSLITGLQKSLIDRTLGTQAHIIVKPPEDVVRPMLSVPGAVVAARMERPAQRLRSILQWQQSLTAIRQLPDVVHVAATVGGSAFAIRGTANRAVVVRGVDADSYNDILNMRSKLVAGTFRLLPSNVVIGTGLAKDFGLEAGDKLRLTTSAGRTEVFNIEGVFDIGKQDLNDGWVFVSLRSAQTLFDLSGGVSTIEVTTRDIFDAERVAQQIAARTGLVADSWMKLNTQLLVGLRSQSNSSYMIQFFVIVAVALGIASVLIVSVVQKSREIGILKAVGTPSKRIVRVFLLEGAVLGLGGSIIGVALGVSLSLFFASLAKNPDGSPTFPVDLNLVLYLRSAAIATFTGIVSAISPARHAARLDPAEVIRYG